VTVLRPAWEVFAKDLRLELRTREALYTMGLFAVLVAVVFVFAFAARDESLAQVAPGVPWVALTFAGTLGLSRSFAREQEDDTLAAVLGSPAPRGAVFAGKAAANVAFMLATELLLVPLCAGMFGLDLGAAPVLHAALFLLGTVGFAAVGTVFAAMLASSRLRELLLPLAFYPVVVPVVIAGVKGTSALLAGDAAAARDWLLLLAGYDAVFVTVSGWAFAWVVEE
jgi:heme exporter protein CcmB